MITFILLVCIGVYVAVMTARETLNKEYQRGYSNEAVKSDINLIDILFCRLLGFAVKSSEDYALIRH